MSSTGSYTGSTVDLNEQLKKEDEERLKKSTARIFPWFFNLAIFIVQLGIFIGFAFFAYGSKAVKNSTCYANVEVDVPVKDEMGYL